VSVTTYPDGTKLTSSALTDNEIQTIFQLVTAQMLGILTGTVSPSITLVSGSLNGIVDSSSLLYPGQFISATGLPANTQITGITGNTVALSQAATSSQTGIQATVTDPSWSSKVRIKWQIQGQPGPPISSDTTEVGCVTEDTEYSRMHDVTVSGSENTLITTDIYTRAWKVSWTFYGPNCVDRARQVRTALVTAQFVTDYLASSNLYVNPDIKVSPRVPENFQAEWWDRADLEAYFNEQVNETSTVGTVGSVEVEVYTKDGKVADFTVTES
jgi:hypothetical protein